MLAYAIKPQGYGLLYDATHLRDIEYIFKENPFVLYCNFKLRTWNQKTDHLGYTIVDC